MSNFLLKVGSIALTLYLFKSGTDTGAKSFDRIVNWGHGMVTRSNLDTLARELEVDYRFDGHFPPDLRPWIRETLRHGPDEDPSLDFWAQPFELTRDNGGVRGAYDLRSCGPDKSCSTRDDIAVLGQCAKLE